MTPEDYVNRLLEISKSKYSLLKEILALSHSQTKMLTEDGLDSLDKLINSKQELIDKINRLDEELDVYFRRLKTVLGVKTLQEIKKPGLPGAVELKEAAEQITDLVSEISEVEKRNNTKAKSLLGELGGKVKNINQGRQMNSAYAPVNIKAPSYFIDKKK